ncbi:unnamed protein product [Onchocerca ochengi]|uniref:SLC12 domain-containing protein n=1 Tax=Onchocerca ochengi TaxID=42157 RepID=A0A182EJ84_ONCOC|nr:unnamed protein product [Onchocerca ochengi]
MVRHLLVTPSITNAELKSQLDRMLVSSRRPVFTLDTSGLINDGHVCYMWMDDVSLCDSDNSFAMEVPLARKIFLARRHRTNQLGSACPSHSMVQQVSLISTRPQRRYIVVILAFLGFANIYAMRANLSVAIVQMTSDTVVTTVDERQVVSEKTEITVS